jgi:hypothetical protein
VPDEKIDVRKVMGRRGYLHEKLGVPEDKKLPMTKLREAAQSDNRTLARRARLAIEMRSWNS